MGFLFFILLFCAIIGIAYFYINKYENAISTLKVHLSLANNELSKIKSSEHSLSKVIRLEFLDLQDSPNTSITFNSESELLLYPDKTAQVLMVIPINTSATILKSALVGNDNWYYVELHVDSNINSSGWVLNNNILFN